MTSRNFFTILLIIIAAVTLFLHLQLNKKINLVLTTSKVKADAYAKDVDALQMSAEGLPDSRLQSPLLVHYPADNSIAITQPLVTIYKQGEPPWQLSAVNGKAVNDLETIYLWENVRLHQARGAHNPTTTLLTSEATLYREEKLAQTEQFVTLERPGIHVQSVGARANIKTGEVILSSNAQAYYDASKTSP